MPLRKEFVIFVPMQTLALQLSDWTLSVAFVKLVLSEGRSG